MYCLLLLLAPWLFEHIAMRSWHAHHKGQLSLVPRFVDMYQHAVMDSISSRVNAAYVWCYESFVKSYLWRTTTLQSEAGKAINTVAWACWLQLHLRSSSWAWSWQIKNFGIRLQFDNQSLLLALHEWDRMISRSAMWIHVALLDNFHVISNGPFHLLHDQIVCPFS